MTLLKMCKSNFGRTAYENPDFYLQPFIPVLNSVVVSYKTWFNSDVDALGYDTIYIFLIYLRLGMTIYINEWSFWIIIILYHTRRQNEAPVRANKTLVSNNRWPGNLSWYCMYSIYSINRCTYSHLIVYIASSQACPANHTHPNTVTIYRATPHISRNY